MSSKAVIRVPVDNDPDIEASVIPAVAKRMVAEGIVSASQAAVIRWGLRDAANPRRRSTTNAGIQNDVARSMIDELRADLAMANGRVVATETAALVLRAELDDAHEALRMERAAVDSLFTKSIALAAAPAPVANVDGARLKSAREAAQLSQQALADLLGYRDRSAVSLAERGRAPLSPKMVAWLKKQER